MMKRNLALFLQVLVVLFGACILVFMLWMPHLEGRNVNATPFEIYFKDPFLAYVYVASIAFFVALYKTVKLLEYIGHGQAFSPASVRALRAIKYCAMALAVFAAGAQGYIVLAHRGTEDIAGGVAMGLIVILGSITVAITAAKYEKRYGELKK